GEAVAGVVGGVADNRGLTTAALIRAGLAMLVGFAMWWVYFDFVGRRPFRPKPFLMYVWVYLHFFLFATIACGGVALGRVVDGEASAFVDELAGCGIGLFLALVGLLELVLARKHDEPTHPVRSPA